MSSLSNIEYVKSLKANLRAALDNEHGKEVMRLLEDLCGWYDFQESDKDKILIAHGKRQVLATIKTLLERTPDEIVALVQQEGI